MFVLSLAVSDLFVATLVMPWRAITEMAGFWPFGNFCQVWVAFDIMCSTASILNLCVISVDRYWAIASPFNYEQKMTCQAALIMISVVWTLSILISFIPVQLNWHKARDLPVALKRTESLRSCDTSLNRTYAITSSVISFYLPVAIMIITYTRIFFIVQKQIRGVSSSTQEGAERHPHLCQDCRQDPEVRLRTSLRKETKVLKTLSIIMGAFVCCWLPFFILNCMVPFCNPALHHSDQLACVSKTTFDVFVWFGWANSTLNPVVYAFNADFRRAFLVLLGCGRLGSRTRVVTVNFSNERASYHHDTPNTADLHTMGHPCMHPHAIGEPIDKDMGFDAVSEMVEGQM
ncbi:dopamine receptor D7 [Aplochiton taeniatus]